MSRNIRVWAFRGTLTICQEFFHVSATGGGDHMISSARWSPLKLKIDAGQSNRSDLHI